MNMTTNPIRSFEYAPARVANSQIKVLKDLRRGLFHRVRFEHTRCWSNNIERNTVETQTQLAITYSLKSPPFGPKLVQSASRSLEV